MKNPVITIPSFVLTTLVYVLLSPIFELDYNAYGEETTKFVIVDNSLYNTHQQVVEVKKECKSPCPSTAEMCIEMCA
jgi:hypothetical protein